MHHLGVTYAHDGVAMKREERVVFNIACSLRVDVVAPVNREHKEVLDEYVDRVAQDPDLRNNSQPEPPEPQPNLRFEPRVRPGNRVRKHTSGRAIEAEPLQHGGDRRAAG